MNKAEQRHSRQQQSQRRAARLRAVQALFQMELGGMGARRVVDEFRQTRLAGGDDSGAQSPADDALFENIVTGVVQNQSRVDAAIAAHLARNWRLERLDATLRALLRAGVYELLFRRDTPARVVLDQYTGLARDFFDGPEAGFVNGALDAVAREERQGELPPP